MSIPMESYNQSNEPKLNLVPDSGETADSLNEFKLNRVEDFFTLDELDNLSGTTAFDARIQRQKETIERLAMTVTWLKEELYQKAPIHKDEKARYLDQSNRIALFWLLAASSSIDTDISNEYTVLGNYEHAEQKTAYEKAYDDCRAKVGEHTLDQIDELYGKYENHPVMSGLRLMDSAVTPMVNSRRIFLVMLDQYS